MKLNNFKLYESYDISIIKELKTILKGKFNTKKEEVFECKNYNELKAIDWTYILKN